MSKPNKQLNQMLWLIFPFMMITVVAIAILGFVFWIWMLVDCLQRKKFDDKLVWVVVLVFLNILGAILYYFIVKKK
ncbi:MAG: PLDc N-terminal domain-containing protein [Fervidobacterium sp.]